MTRNLLVLGDVKNPSSGEWPQRNRLYGHRQIAAISIFHSKMQLKTLDFLLLDRSKQGDDVKIRKEDYKFTDLKNHSQIFLKDDDESIYTNPYYVHDIRMTGSPTRRHF